VALCTLTTVVDLGSSLVLSNGSGGPHHIQGRHTRGLYIGLKKTIGFDFEYSLNI
jgi:hypothetical protein